MTCLFALFAEDGQFVNELNYCIATKVKIHRIENHLELNVDILVIYWPIITPE